MDKIDQGEKKKAAASFIMQFMGEVQSLKEQLAQYISAAEYVNGLISAQNNKSDEEKVNLQAHYDKIAELSHNSKYCLRCAFYSYRAISQATKHTNSDDYKNSEKCYEKICSTDGLLEPNDAEKILTNLINFAASEIITGLVDNCGDYFDALTNDTE